MRAFVWTMVVLMAFEAVMKLWVLATGRGDLPRSVGSTAGDVVVNVYLIVWATVLLAGQS